MKTQMFMWGLIVCLIGVGFANGQEPDLTGIKCVINGKKGAKIDTAVPFQGGNVYFCCDKCADKFKNDLKKGDDARYLIKANHQLVLTSQFVQKSCPFSGKPFLEQFATTVGGVEIGFCNADCCEKVTQLSKLSEKAKLVFNNDAFRKGFVAKSNSIDLKQARCPVSGKTNVTPEQSMQYKSGTVYFANSDSMAAFRKDTQTFAAKANRQLVTTGQYVQTGCPISGGEVDDEEVVDVSGVSVRFCCNRCSGKVARTADEDKRIELVFGEKRFDKSFSKK
ncbi:MAG: hypothetical protein AAF939_02535 [Planctomycetota bacterium]